MVAMRFNKWRYYVGVGIICFCLAQSVEAWQSHFLLTASSVANMPEIDRQPTVPAETLTEFLEAESEGLVSLLKDIDSWPHQVSSFPPLPSLLTFKGRKDTQRSLLQQFTDRARIHPQGVSDMHYDTLFVEYGPNAAHRIHNPLQLKDVVLASIIKEIPIANPPLEKVNPGELVSPYEIITSAVDEPDFGMDINLFEDNHTDFGENYKLGNTPGFINKDLIIGTQAPFHIGWYHENAWIKRFGPDITKMYPEYRIHFFVTLSQYAFKTGHLYWGYRFLGWAIHYQQDLSQPYHAKLVPGMSAMELLVANQEKVKNRVTNLHFALENYQYNLMRRALTEFNINNNSSNPFLIALADRSSDNSKIHYNDLYPRNTVAQEAYDDADTLDDSLINVFGKTADDIANSNDGVNQSAVILNFGSIDFDLYSKINQDDPEVQTLNQKLVTLFRSVGSHTRKIILYATDQRNWPDKMMSI